MQFLMADDEVRMIKARNPLVRLQDLQHFLAGSTLEQSLGQQAATTAALVGAASCSIMLLGSKDGTEPRMSMYARHGDFPDAALKASIAHGEGIAGRVLASGEALLVEDIGKSEFAALARRGARAGASLLCAPIRIDGNVVGVINAASGVGQPSFGETELRLLEVTALFIGKSIQVQQLQHLLASRFAQLALLQEAREKVGESVATAYRNPEDVARILARSFFREMTKAGFEPGQIVSAASELIGQLNQRLQQGGKMEG
jgi:signal transduction protein with GAF and PtsI domain